MILETYPITILVDDLAGIFHIGVLIYHSRCRLENIYKKDTYEKPNQKRHELQMIKEFHIGSLV